MMSDSCLINIDWCYYILQLIIYEVILRFGTMLIAKILSEKCVC